MSVKTFYFIKLLNDVPMTVQCKGCNTHALNNIPFDVVCLESTISKATLKLILWYMHDRIVEKLYPHFIFVRNMQFYAMTFLAAIRDFLGVHLTRW